ncbi:hypothetical protein V5F38_10825 [Xanthobacter sp. V0B-10]|uniref:hypothetical protein n=1 Tax=Xanthobacter albus TaxID=3119929 RepID=UPI00372AD7E0
MAGLTEDWPAMNRAKPAKGPHTPKFRPRGLEHFQKKCETVLHPEMHKNKMVERFR